MEEKRSHLTLILAETMLGLDSVKADLGKDFTESPWLLQIWLMERLSLFRLPANIGVYGPKDLCSRGKIWPNANERSEYYFDNYIRSQHLTW